MGHLHRFWVCLLVLAFAGAPSACAKRPAPAGESAEAIAPTDDTLSAPDAVPVTEAEAQAFAEALLLAVSNDDAFEVDALINWTALVARASEGTGVRAEAEKIFLNAVRRTAVSPQGIPRRICASVAQGGDFKLLRIYEMDGEWRPLFRMPLQDRAVGYYEFTLAREPSGVRVHDINAHSQGEPLSSTFRRSLLQIAANDNRKTVKETEYLASAEDLEKLGSAVNEGRNQEALDIYRKLPPSVQEDKTTLLLRYRATQSLGDDEYLAAIDKLREVFPNDPSIDLVLLDGWMLRKEFAELDAAIDRIDRRVGGDPYLDIMRANALMEQSKFAEAHERLDQALAREPTLVTAYWTHVAVTLRDRDFGATARYLDEIVEKFQWDLGDLATGPEYADFVASPEYERWNAKRAPPAGSE